MLPLCMVFSDEGGKSVFLIDPGRSGLRSLSQEEVEIVKDLLSGPKALSRFSETGKSLNTLLESGLVEEVDGKVKLKVNVLRIDPYLVFQKQYKGAYELASGLFTAMTFYIRQTYRDLLPENKKEICNIIRSILMYHTLWQLRHQESLFDWEEKYVAPNLDKVSPVFQKWMNMLSRFEDPSKAAAEWAKTGIPSLRESEFSLYKKKSRRLASIDS